MWALEASPHERTDCNSKLLERNTYFISAGFIIGFRIRKCMKELKMESVSRLKQFNYLNAERKEEHCIALGNLTN